MPVTARALPRLNTRPCHNCGRETRNPVICAECYKKTPAGRAEIRDEVRMRKYEPIENGGPCEDCKHWFSKCGLGFPEGGTRFAAECPAMIQEGEL